MMRNNTRTPCEGHGMRDMRGITPLSPFPASHASPAPHASRCRPLQILPQPPLHFAPPPELVLWLAHPVALVRENQEPCRDTIPAERGERLEPLRIRNTEILLAIDH